MKTISLTKGMIAVVDDEDFESLNRFKWYATQASGRFYAARRDVVTKKIVLMHRQIMNPMDGQLIDHRETERTLDNRKSNLRVCNHAQNHQNAPKRKTPTSSRFKGVHFYKSRNKWIAYVVVDGRQAHLGYFATEKAAALAYNDAAAKHFGEFARFNQVE
jgi:hypothetical protein